MTDCGFSFSVIVILEVLIALGLMALGRIPAPGAAEGLALLAIFL